MTPPCFNPQSDELGLQKKLRTEVIQLEDTLAQVRKEYEMLRIEFEQNLAANEQAGTWPGQVEGGHLGCRAWCGPCFPRHRRLSPVEIHPAAQLRGRPGEGHTS